MLEDKLEELGNGFAAIGLNRFAVDCYLCGANKEAKALVKALNGEVMDLPRAWIADGIRESRNDGFVHDRV